MIILFLIICIFFYLICSKLIKSIPLRLITFIIIIITLQFILVLMHNIYVCNIPIVDTNTLYHNLKHGDIVFTCKRNDNLYNPLLSMNYGVSHIMMVIEKDGEKYLLHAYPNTDKNPDYLLDENPMFGIFGGPPMRLFLEPAMLMILCYDKMVYQVFRPTIPLKNDISPVIETRSIKLLDYCCRALSKTLIDNNIIDTDSTLICNYRPEQIIHQLVRKKVPSFFMIHD